MQGFRIVATNATIYERRSVDRQLDASIAIYDGEHNPDTSEFFDFYLEDNESYVLDSLKVPASCRLVRL